MIYNNYFIKSKFFISLFLNTLFFIPCFASTGDKKLPEKVVVLTFDDAIETQYSVVMPLLKKYSFGATFFVCEFPPDFADKTKYMSWKQIAQLNHEGFEIANHSKSHTQVTDYGDNMPEKFAADLDSIEQRCLQYGIPRPVTFAYPACTTNPAALEGVKGERLFTGKNMR